jgi:hypothetical protein
VTHLDPPHQRALWLAKADRLCHILGHLVDLHANAPACDTPRRTQLVGNAAASSIGMANEMPMKPPDRE